MTEKISDKDKEDWNNFITSKEKLDDKDNSHFSNQIINEKTIDLHGYNLRDANFAVKNFIINSYNKGVKKLKIITGKGSRSKNMEDPYKANKLSILKYSVPEFIQNNADLIKMIKKIDIDDINNRSSGHFSIYLKTKKNENRY